MIQEFTVQGKWSFPSYSGDEFCGTLTYTPSSGGLLRVSGLRKDIKELYTHLKSNIEIILGKTTSGPMTLTDCYLVEPPRRIMVSDETTIGLVYHTKTILWGGHFKRKSDIKFRRLTVRYTHLDGWALTSGIDFSTSGGDDKFDYVLSFRLPEKNKATISQFKPVKDLQISIEPELRLSDLSLQEVVSKRRCITQFYRVIIETPDLAALETLGEILYLFRNFLSLAVSGRVFPLIINAQSETDPLDEIEVFYQLDHFASDVPDISRSDMLFTLPEIGERFEEVIGDWFGKAELLEPVVDLYFGIRHNPYVYTIHSFLSLVQALETYHMRFAKKYELDEKTSAELLSSVNRVCENLSEDPYNVAQWNRDPRILLRRVLEILIYYTISGAICGKGLVDFGKEVVDARHYYTHYDPDKPQRKQRVARGIDLDVMAKRLAVILEVCLLSELGFTKDEIAKRVWKTRGPLLQALANSKTAFSRLPTSRTPFSKLS